jgi:cell fate (sporulation/competence/biofilm development) regulator YmcA (YheA/YmcA/DUF963 family)
VTKKTEKLVDEIKDEVDSLGDIKSAKQRVEAAQELIRYIECCFVHYQENT